MGYINGIDTISSTMVPCLVASVLPRKMRWKKLYKKQIWTCTGTVSLFSCLKPLQEIIQAAKMAHKWTSVSETDKI